MKNHHARSLMALAILGTLTAGAAHAQDSYPYLGLSVGKSRTNLDEQAIANAVVGGPQRATITSTSPKDTGYKVFGGYQINRYFAIEGGYFNLGQFEFKSSVTPAGTLNGQVRVQGGFADVVGLLPLSDSFSLLGRAGGQYARTRDNLSTTGAAIATSANPADRQGGYKVGVGLQYAFTPSVLMRLEGERYRVSDGFGHKLNANLYSVGLVFPFGRSSAPAPKMAAYTPMATTPPPAPVAAAPMPAPVVVAVATAPLVMPAPAPVPQRVSFAAESLFGFDRSELRPEGKVALDAFVQQTQGTRYDTITVEGHTDRLGSTAYNQTLSQQRADAVKSYLVAEGRLDPAKVQAVGKSESMPVTKPEDCKGKTQNAKLVACLQPDRRVEIEVSGTR